MVSHYDPSSGYADRTIFTYFFVQFSAGIGLILVVIMPFFDRINALNSTVQKSLLFLLHGLAFGLCYTLLFCLIFEWYNLGSLSKEFWGRFTKLLVTDFHNSVRTYLIFLTILIAFDYFRRHTASILEKKNAENEVEKIKLASLKAQLQPHFLFNALNNVVALVDENKNQAKALIVNLSDLLRYTINLNPQRRVTVAEEIGLIRKYVDIERAKYEDQLRIDWDIDEGARTQLIPPMIVQPLIENAIKHGFRANTKTLDVMIRMQPRLIEVRNNGAPLPDYPRVGQGLSIVKKRLALHYHDQATFRLREANGWVISQIAFHEEA